MPSKNSGIKKKQLKEFLNFTNSTYAAIKVLFSENDYSYNIINFPKQTGKFASTFYSNINVDCIMPDYPADSLGNTVLLKYFPIEWIIKNILNSTDNKVIRFNEEKNEFYIDTFVPKTEYSNKLSIIAETIEIADKKNRMGEIFTAYLKDTSI